MLAPPWIPVPAPAYGGIEEVIRLLCDGLTERGHDVTQFEADHVARTFAAIDAAREHGPPFDVIHDHVGHTALAMADRVSVPLVHTLHGPFDERATSFYAEHGRKACIVAISQAQLDAAPTAMGGGRVVPNPIDCSEWPYRAEKDDFLLWIGRMSPDKGPHRAITAAREAGAPLVLAGPVQPGQESFFASEVEPHLDGE